MKQKLREIRIENKLSLDELAKLSGISKSQIQRIEMNETIPTICVAYNLAKALNVDIWDIFDCK